MASRIVLSLALAAAAASVAPTRAEVVSVDMDAHVASILFGPTDANSAFATGDPLSLTLVYDTSTPGIVQNPPTTIYPGALLSLSVQFASGYAFTAASGTMEVTDYATAPWDQIYWQVRDDRAEIFAPLVGDAKLTVVTSGLTDTRRTALSSQALVPYPPIAAWTGTYINFIFVDQSTNTTTQVTARVSAISPTDAELPSLGLGEWHTCLVRAGGGLGCWGLNDHGQSTPPSGGFVRVSGGWIHSCGLRADRTLACWGHNGQNRATPPAGNFTQVTTGRNHNCALRTDGTVACWGDNQFGQASPPSGTFLAIGAGQQHTCGVRGDRSIVCWGVNSDGQASPPAGTFRAVSGGLFHSCGLKTDGTVQCWGANHHGQVSPPAGTFAQIDSGWHFNCGVRDTGAVACWGSNQDGQLNSPPGAFRQVEGGLWHACGVRTDGRVQCWGDNSQGQAPQPSVQPETLPAGEEGTPYAQTLSLAASGYSTPAAGFALADGALPSGLALSAAGVLDGTPDTVGSSTFVVDSEDLNGFAASRAYTVDILTGDDTAPVIAPVVTGTLGSDGWYTGDVSVSWTVVDDESAITATNGCTPQVVDADTAGATFECTASSTGGTATGAVTVKRDATAPELAPMVTPATVLLGGTATADAHASDTLSGLAAQSCDMPTTATPGVHEVTCHAEDAAGNTASATATYTVVYGFVGFFAPVENPSAINLANAGRTLPFKWRLVDAAGAPVTTLAGATVRVTSIACDGSESSDAIEEYAASNTGLMNLGGGEYQYNWQSPKSFENSCRKVTVDLGDGATHFALFRFR